MSSPNSRAASPPRPGRADRPGVPVRFWLTGLLLLVAAGCTFGPRPPGRIPDPPATTSPAEAFRRFSEALRAENYEAMFALLSRDTQARYELWEFDDMFKKTRFGKLFRHLMLNWRVRDYRVEPDLVQAIVTLEHPTAPGYAKAFGMSLEGGDWKVRLTIAQALDMPEFDERFLFPERFMPPEFGEDDRAGEGPPPAPRPRASPGDADHAPSARIERRPDRR